MSRPPNPAKMAKRLRNKQWGHPLLPYDASAKRRHPIGTGGHKHSRFRWPWCEFCPHREHQSICACKCTGRAHVLTPQGREILERALAASTG